MRRHSGIDGDPTMLEVLSDDISREALSLGVYAYNGTGRYFDRSTYEIAAPSEGFIEHNGIRDGEAARVTLFDGEGWWSELGGGRLFGVEEELFVPAEQFDGVIVVRDVHPSEQVDVDVIGRLPLR